MRRLASTVGLCIALAGCTGATASRQPGLGARAHGGAGLRGVGVHRVSAFVDAGPSGVAVRGGLACWPNGVSDRFVG